MNIVVCIKQVPDVQDIKWTKENNLDRQGMLSKLNTADEWALDWALYVKKHHKEARITVITMGPNQAKDILEYALAKGADRAILLSDKAFSGSDTLITAKILSCAIKKCVPNYTTIITGQKADDGDTEQVPVSLAQFLDIIDTTNVIEIRNIDKNTAIISQNVDSEINMLEMNTPCLIAVKKNCPEVYVPKIDDYIHAQNSAIEIYDTLSLGIEKDSVGIIASPTMVHKAFRMDFEKETKEITNDFTKNILDTIFKVQHG